MYETLELSRIIFSSTMTGITLILIVIVIVNVKVGLGSGLRAVWPPYSLAFHWETQSKTEKSKFAISINVQTRNKKDQVIRDILFKRII